MLRVSTHSCKLRMLFFIFLALLGMGTMNWTNAAPVSKDPGSIPSNWMAGGGG